MKSIGFCLGYILCIVGAGAVEFGRGSSGLGVPGLTHSPINKHVIPAL